MVYVGHVVYVYLQILQYLSSYILFKHCILTSTISIPSGKPHRIQNSVNLDIAQIAIQPPIFAENLNIY